MMIRLRQTQNRKSPEIENEIILFLFEILHRYAAMLYLIFDIGLQFVQPLCTLHPFTVPLHLPELIIFTQIPGLC